MSDERDDALRRSDARHWRKGRNRFETNVAPPPTIVPNQKNMPPRDPEKESLLEYLLRLGNPRSKHKK